MSPVRRLGRDAVRGTRASPLMGRCEHKPLCDVIAVYRESSVCAETRDCPYQSGIRLEKESNGRIMPQRRERSMSSAGSTPTGRAQVQTARFRAGMDGGRFIDAPIGNRGIAR